jgi:hypothetical protein
MAEADPRFIDRHNNMLAIGEGPDWTLPIPPRPGCRVVPLIEAADMFPMLEHLVLDAVSSVWLSFRVFDPETATRSERAIALGLSDWASLIHHAVARGVEVRILLADFEPVLADYLHAGSWHTFQRIRDIAASLPEASRERLQLIVIQHEGEIGWCWRQLLRPFLRTPASQIVGQELIRPAARTDDGGFRYSALPVAAPGLGRRQAHRFQAGPVRRRRGRPPITKYRGG